VYVPTPGEGVEGANVAIESIVVVVVLGRVDGATNFLTCTLNLLERVVVGGGVVGGMS
jgi:hypothetical protein